MCRLICGSKKRLLKHILSLSFPNNTGKVSDDLAVHEANVKLKIFQAGIVFNRLEVPVLMPVFTRPGKSWKIYTHALDRDSLLTKDARYKRFDLQLKAMIKDARNRLLLERLNTEERILMYGFSASGMFVNRFSFLHPEIVKAVALGSPGGWAIAPLATYEKRQLTYPIGIGDLKKVTGCEFGLEKLRDVPMFVFIGGKDDNDSVVYRDGYEKNEEELIFKLFGKTPIERWQISKKLYAESGLNATFKLFPETGHTVSRGMRRQIMKFLEKHKN